MYIDMYIHVTLLYLYLYLYVYVYGVATISRLLKIIGLFFGRDL